jgi:hypothetical protein
MYVKRRKNKIEGVFQATSFTNKPPNSLGLRKGGYFLTLQVCQAIKQFYDSKMRLRPKQKLGDHLTPPPAPENPKFEESTSAESQTHHCRSPVLPHELTAIPTGTPVLRTYFEEAPFQPMVQSSWSAVASSMQYEHQQQQQYFPYASMYPPTPTQLIFTFPPPLSQYTNYYF